MREFLPTFLLAAALVGCSSDSDSAPVDDGMIRVTPADIGDSWLVNDTRAGGTVSIAADSFGPRPLGDGSLQLSTTDTQGGSGQAKAQLYYYGYGSLGDPLAGVALSDLTALAYTAYRDATSTNPAAQTVSLNIEVDFVGDGTSYTTLVFEPIYNTDQGAIQPGTWQRWDAFNGGQAVWWSTRAIPGAPSNSFVALQTIIDNNPNAKIIYGVGFSAGSGWTGDFFGAVDALEVGISGETVTYDFEPQ
ncbi:MAG: hypothetical protein AAGD14_00765 [Planctomycetota bacterium]